MGNSREDWLHAYRLDTPTHTGLRNVFHTRNHEEEYRVEEIVGERWRRYGRGQRRELRVRWTGWDGATWEPATAFADTEALYRWEERFAPRRGEGGGVMSKATPICVDPSGSRLPKVFLRLARACAFPLLYININIHFCCRPSFASLFFFFFSFLLYRILSAFIVIQLSFDNPLQLPTWRTSHWALRSLTSIRS